MQQRIYLIVRFNFPRPFRAEYGEKAKALHQSLQGHTWIEEIFAASGGIGPGPAALWVFRLQNYAGLDELFHGDNPVSKAYMDFFSVMEDVTDSVREEVLFA